MKILVSGSRSITNYSVVEEILRYNHLMTPFTEIISGGARGVDRLVERFAKEHAIPIRIFLPNWEQLGKSAGIIRNKEMVDRVDMVICIWDGISRGTKSTYDYAKQRNKPVILYYT